MMLKITALSTICADIFDGADTVRLGGEAYNFVMAACGYEGLKLSVIAGVGDDSYGRMAVRCLEERNIDTSCVHLTEGGKTASNRIYLTPEGDRYFKSDSWDGGVYQDFELGQQDREKLRESDFVFINYYSPNFQETLQLKEEYGYQLAVDFDMVRDLDAMEKLVSHIDFIFISGEEGLLPVFAKWSRKYQGIFNMTLAEQGSVTFWKGREYRAKAVPVQEVVDTTGCGDGYHAGFLVSYAKEQDILKAMEEGSEIASRILSGMGGSVNMLS